MKFGMVIQRNFLKMRKNNENSFSEFKSKFEKKKVLEVKNSVVKNPLVSVCVQTYQHVDYIRECLEGILKQNTSFSFEILLGEDESSDGTREICKEYANKYPEKIRLFLHHRINNIKVNGLPTGRFNFLTNIYSSRGKYIALCEGDDYWTDPLKLQKQVDFLEENPEFAIHSGNAMYFSNFSPLHGEPVQKEVSSRKYSLKDFEVQNYLLTCTVIFRNLDFNMPLIFTKVIFGDWFLYVYILNQTGLQAFISPENFADYRIQEKGIMHKLGYYNLNYFHIMQIKYINQYLKINSYSKGQEKAINQYALIMFEMALKNKSYFLSFKSFYLNFRYIGSKIPYKQYIQLIKNILKR